MAQAVSVADAPAATPTQAGRQHAFASLAIAEAGEAAPRDPTGTGGAHDLRSDRRHGASGGSAQPRCFCPLWRPGERVSEGV